MDVHGLRNSNVLGFGLFFCWGGVFIEGSGPWKVVLGFRFRMCRLGADDGTILP